MIAPTLSYAQASITGFARDTSGAVLPGVSVEATSPYALTFTLTGFSTVKRDGIDQTYGVRRLTPTLVLPARFARVSAQFDF